MTFCVLTFIAEMLEVKGTLYFFDTFMDFLFIAECFIWQQSQGHGSEC